MDTPPQVPADSHKGKTAAKPPNHRSGSALVRVLIAVLVLAVVAETAGTGYNVLVARGVVRGAELPTPPFVLVPVPSNHAHTSGTTGGRQATATPDPAAAIVQMYRHEWDTQQGLDKSGYTPWIFRAENVTGEQLKQPGSVFITHETVVGIIGHEYKVDSIKALGNQWGHIRIVVFVEGAEVVKNPQGVDTLEISLGVIGPDGKPVSVIMNGGPYEKIATPFGMHYEPPLSATNPDTDPTSGSPVDPALFTEFNSLKQAADYINDSSNDLIGHTAIIGHDVTIQVGLPGLLE